MADIQKLNVNGNTYDISTTWEKVTGKPSTFTPSSHTHTFASLTSKPTTLSGYGITDAYTSSTIDSKLSGYLPLSGGKLNGTIQTPLVINTSSTVEVGVSYGMSDVSKAWVGYNPYSGTILYNYACRKVLGLKDDGTPHYEGNTLIHTGNYNSYAPTLTGTGASGTWGINISGNAASADYASSAGLLKLATSQNPDTSSIGQIFATSYNEGIPSGGYMYLSGITLASNNDANYKVQLGLDLHGKVFSRWQSAGNWQDWNRLAFITDNVASVTKLQTPRTLWGQSFDGTGDVSGSLYGANSILSNTTNGYYVGNRNDGLGATTGGLLLYSYGNTPMSFYTNSSERMHITGDGKVGIGTTSPSTKLDVVGGQFRCMAGDADTTYGMHHGFITGYHGIDVMQFFEQEYKFYPNGGGNSCLVSIYGKITASDKILIGTTTDNGYKLQVNGSANATTLYENGTRVALSGHTHSYLPLSGGTVSGTITATGFYQSSDERLKTFYEPIKPDLEKLRKLRKNYFKFNDKDKLEIGVSAQEVQSIYPEIVSTDDNGYLSVAYDKLSVIALAAIDELDDKILQLANKISTLENILNKLMGEKGIN